MNAKLIKTLTSGLMHGIMCQLTQADFPKSLYMKTHGKNIIEPLVGFKHDKFYVGGNRVDVDTWEFKPYLFPLSSITKEIEVKGERFVPVEELCRVFYGHGKTKYRISDNDVFVLCEHRNGESVYVHKDLRLVDFWIVEWLIEHHFNIYNLSPDQFIEVNETNNPYR